MNIPGHIGSLENHFPSDSDDERLPVCQPPVVHCFSFSVIVFTPDRDYLIPIWVILLYKNDQVKSESRLNFT